MLRLGDCAVKEVLTTGEVARLCGVAPRTVSKWFDSGQLRGFKIPGSRDRRIPRESLVRFMKAHGIPLRGLDGNATRVLLAETDYDFADAMRMALERGFDYDVMVTSSVFEAGLQARQFRPHVLFLDVHMPGLDPSGLRRALQGDPDLVGTRVVAVCREDEDDARLGQFCREFDVCLKKPYSLRDAVRVIEDSTDLVS